MAEHAQKCCSEGNHDGILNVPNFQITKHSSRHSFMGEIVGKPRAAPWRCKELQMLVS